MRCAVPTIFYSYADAGKVSLVQVNGFQLGPDVTECLPGELALLSYAELGNVTANPFRLSLDEAGQIATAILLVWAVGFGIRQMIRAIHDSRIEDES